MRGRQKSDKWWTFPLGFPYCFIPGPNSIDPKNMIRICPQYFIYSAHKQKN